MERPLKQLFYLPSMNFQMVFRTSQPQKFGYLQVAPDIVLNSMIRCDILAHAFEKKEKFLNGLIWVNAPYHSFEYQKRTATSLFKKFAAIFNVHWIKAKHQAVA